MIDAPSFNDVSKLRQEIERLNGLLKKSERECCRLRLKLGIKRRNPKAKQDILKLIESGLKNCEIEKIGYSKSTIKLVRSQIKKP